jgi:hypothetical protein
VARAYGVVTGDRASASRWTFYIGKDGTILYIDKSGATSTQGQEVVNRLKALGITRQP